MQSLHDFTATLQIGIVTECDDAKHAVRVRLPALEDMLSDWLPVVVANAGGNRFYALPDPGEQVVCMLDARGEGGVVLGAIYNAADPTPASSRDIWCKEFTNGTRIEHNRTTGRVMVDTPGDVLIKAGGKVNCKSFLHYSVEHKDFEYEQKGHYPKKGVMPCAKS